MKDHKIYVSKNIQGLSQVQMQLLIESAGGEVIIDEKDKN